ncbi:uncharacterized protein [Fopius arisanus]|uniref:EBAG9 protein n=1 Tax=Fopius arisanus TaxID=64838 RepID=A0A0C9PI66_9HYME|nr:PREDICTED: uncharacterized protein LOC105269000 [Fopius arisanus]
MALEFMINRVKALVVLLLGVFRRALCCLRRRRRSSCDSIPLAAVGVVPNASSNRVEHEHWEQWDENPVVVVPDKPINPIQSKIDQYRQQISKPPEPMEEPQINFFEDMAPRITKQKKVLIKKKSEESGANFSKFAIAAERIPTNNLEVWDDNAATWEDETTEEFGDPTEELRRQKRREREKKIWEQQQRRMEYNYRPPPLGEKIVS